MGNSIIDFYKALKKYLKESKANYGQNIKLFNCCSITECESNWFRDFINYRELINPVEKISIFCTFGILNKAISFNNDKFKIYYTSENNHAPYSEWKKYEHLFLDDNRIILSIGFDYINHPQYARFPFWILRHFNPSDSLLDIKHKIDTWNNQHDRIGRKKQCAFICREDYYGQRSRFADIIESVLKVNYPSQFRHNDDELHSKLYENDKLKYLRQFRFNLCPENTNNEGYVTEKIFDAISSGCIPIYWGSNNVPEPEILNPKSIIYLTLDGDNSDALEKIRLLSVDTNAYNEFVNQPYFAVEAPERIWEMLQNLENKIRAALSK